LLLNITKAFCNTVESRYSQPEGTENKVDYIERLTISRVWLRVFSPSVGRDGTGGEVDYIKKLTLS